MEVQGFCGTTLLYDNAYIVNTTEAKLVNFNYAGITEAKFIPSGGTLHTGYATHSIDNTDFAMDNVTVSTPDGGVTAGLLGMALISLVTLRKRFAGGERFSREGAKGAKPKKVLGMENSAR